MHALCQEGVSSLPPGLLPSDSDASLLSEPARLAAAARKLDGRAVKLLPGERCAAGKLRRACVVLCWVKRRTCVPQQNE
jgi:hypothetical protein